jgi:hypothetical protein
MKKTAADGSGFFCWGWRYCAGQVDGQVGEGLGNQKNELCILYCDRTLLTPEWANNPKMRIVHFVLLLADRRSNPLKKY